MATATTYTCLVEYAGAPTRPHCKATQPAPAVGELLSATVCGTTKTRLTVRAIGASPEEARRNAIDVARYYAHIMQLSGEPVGITVR